MSSTVTAPGTYQQYKNDTAIFLTWLSQAAQASGWIPGTASQPRHASKQPSDSSVAASQTKLRVREIVEQARCIIDCVSPVLHFPQAIANLARRAISTRREFTTRFFNLDLPSSPHDRARNSAHCDANQTHEFFTNTLQDALDLLESRRSKPPDRPPGTAIPNTCDAELTNRFSLLQIEDCEDYNEVLSYLRGQDQASRPKPSLSAPAFQDDLVDTDDICMRTFCFFEDINALRGQLRQVWRSYQQGSTEIVPATVATNVAIAIVEQMEQELVNSLPSTESLLTAFDMRDFERESSYTALIGILSSSATGIEVLDPFVSCTNLGRMWLFDISIIVAKFGRAAFQRSQNQKDLSQIRVNAKMQGDMIKSPPSWKIWPHVYTLETAALMSSRWGNEFLKHARFPELEKSDNLLTPILMDTMLRRELIDSEPTYSQARVKQADQFTKSLMAVKKGHLTTDLVFAAAVLLDIHTILGQDVLKPWGALKSFASKCWSRVKHATYDPKNPTPKSGPCWLKQDAGHVNIIEQCNQLVRDEPAQWSNIKDLTPKFQPDGSFRMGPNDLQYAAMYVNSLSVSETEFERRLSTIASLQRPYILPSKDRDLFWTGNPLASGTMIFNMSLAMEQAGIALANHHLSILWMSYLYTALKQRNLLEGTWPDIDKLIEVHISSMFFGSLPESPAKMFNIFMLRLGATPSHGQFKELLRLSVFGLGGDRTGKQPRSHARASCLSISDTADAMCQWYDGQQTLMRAVHDVQRVMLPKKGSAKKSSSFDTWKFLDSFCGHLLEDNKRLSIDYIGLTRLCSDLLQGLLDTKEIKMADEAYDPENYRKSGKSKSQKQETKETNNPIFVHMVKNILWEDKEWEEHQPQLKKLARTHLIGRESYIAIAGEFCQKYLDSRGVLCKSGDKEVRGDDSKA